MLKEIEVLDWCSIIIKFALDKTSKDGQKFKEKVMKLENTLAMEWYMFWECSFFDLIFFGLSFVGFGIVFFVLVESYIRNVK
jgi:hypothetical protein